MESAQSHKAHRQRRAGRKAKRQKQTPNAPNASADPTASDPSAPSNLRRKDEAAGTDAGARTRNPKAFAFHSAVKAAKAVHRAADLGQKKTHVLTVDRTPADPPPVVVAVVGPPKVGKSTVVRGLIRCLTRQKVENIQGPVTIVSGKKRRLTLLECPNDVNAMIDVAKVADLVLLLVDASFGLEMDTFEFLNICQVHGMPRIIGVLTHLDLIKNVKKVKTVKKTLKHRFWTEVYQGAKLFYLSGMVGDKYLMNEMRNLARFVSVMKFRPLDWRSSHPYVLADRVEDITPEDTIAANAKCDRNVVLYGYVRGTHFRHKADAHIPGQGDVRIADLRPLPDPCPLPTEAKKRSLDSRERIVYAPLSGISGILYDKDAVYVSDKGAPKNASAEDKLIRKLGNKAQPLDDGLQSSGLALFSGADNLPSEERDLHFQQPGSSDEEEDSDEEEVEEDDDDEDDSEGEGDEKPRRPVKEKDASRAEFLEAVGEEARGAEEAWRQRLSDRAQTLFSKRPPDRINWPHLVYAQEPEAESQAADEEELMGGIFRLAKGASDEAERALDHRQDTASFHPARSTLPSTSNKDWASQEVKESIADCFVGKDWAEEDGEDGSDDGEDPFGRDSG